MGWDLRGPWKEGRGFSGWCVALKAGRWMFCLGRRAWWAVSRMMEWDRLPFHFWEGLFLIRDTYLNARSDAVGSPFHLWDNSL